MYNPFAPGTGTIHSVAFKYASILLKMNLYAESEVFTFDVKSAGKLYRSSMGLHFLFGIVVVSDNPNMDYTVGHELGHDALKRAFTMEKLQKKNVEERDLSEETLCDVCGFEYWALKNQVVFNKAIFKELFSNIIKYVKSTFLDIGSEKSLIVKSLVEHRVRLNRAWEWLQYAMQLEKEGKIPKLDPAANPMDYEAEKKARIEELGNMMADFFKEKRSSKSI